METFMKDQKIEPENGTPEHDRDRMTALELEIEEMMKMETPLSGGEYGKDLKVREETRRYIIDIYESAPNDYYQLYRDDYLAWQHHSYKLTFDTIYCDHLACEYAINEKFWNGDFKSYHDVITHGETKFQTLRSAFDAISNVENAGYHWDHLLWASGGRDYNAIIRLAENFCGDAASDASGTT